MSLDLHHPGVGSPGVGEASGDDQGMVLDRLVPEWDARRVEHRVVDGTPEEVYAVVIHADFLDAARRSPVVRGLFAIRSAGERLVGLGRHATSPTVEAPSSLRLVDLGDEGEWVRLGASGPHEFAFGAVGRFWAGKTTWERVAASEWSRFDRPGFAKIGCNLSLRPYGEGRTLVSYEARTRATDEAARRGFLRYWRVVGPFVGVVMRGMLSVIARDARS